MNGSFGNIEKQEGDGNFNTSVSPFDWKPMKGDRLKLGDTLFIIRGITPGGNYICFRCNDRITMFLEESVVLNGIRNGNIEVVRD